MSAQRWNRWLLLFLVSILVWGQVTQVPPVSSGAPPTGAAGGDLSGTYPNPGVANVNGTPVPVNSAADQVIVTTASATGAWKSVPNCTDSAGNHINYTAATHTFSCGTTGSGGPPTGAAGGDLSGTYPNPTVAKVNGTSIPTNAAADQVVITTSAAVGAYKSIPDCTDTGGNHLNYTASTHAVSCGTSGGGGTTGANFGQVTFTDPSLVSWTQQDFGSCTSDTTVPKSVDIYNPTSEASPNIHALVKNIPGATPYHCEFAFISLHQAGGNFMAGPCFTDGTKYQIYDPRFASPNQFVSFYCATKTAINTTPINQTTFFQYDPVLWVRLGDDGANRTTDVSIDGFHWTQIATESHTNNLTPTKVGFYVTGGVQQIRLVHYKETN